MSAQKQASTRAFTLDTAVPLPKMSCEETPSQDNIRFNGSGSITYALECPKNCYSGTNKDRVAV